MVARPPWHLQLKTARRTMRQAFRIDCNLYLAKIGKQKRGHWLHSAGNLAPASVYSRASRAPADETGTCTLKGTVNSALQSGQTIFFRTSANVVCLDSCAPVPCCSAVVFPSPPSPPPSVISSPPPSSPLSAGLNPALQQAPIQSTPHPKHHCPCPHPGNLRTSLDLLSSLSRQMRHVWSV